MIIECATCAVRDVACHDCVVTVLLGPPGAERDGTGAVAAVELEEAERAAIAVLAGSGLVPPLRLVPAPGEPGDPGAHPHGPPDLPPAIGVGV